MVPLRTGSDDGIMNIVLMNQLCQGLEDFIVVDTEDTLLIFPKSEEQSIKEVSKEAEAKLGSA